MRCGEVRLVLEGFWLIELLCCMSLLRFVADVSPKIGRVRPWHLNLPFLKAYRVKYGSADQDIGMRYDGADKA